MIARVKTRNLRHAGFDHRKLLTVERDKTSALRRQLLVVYRVLWTLVNPESNSVCDSSRRDSLHTAKNLSWVILYKIRILEMWKPKKKLKHNFVDVETDIF